MDTPEDLGLDPIKPKVPWEISHQVDILFKRIMDAKSTPLMMEEKNMLRFILEEMRGWVFDIAIFSNKTQENIDVEAVIITEADNANYFMRYIPLPSQLPSSKAKP